ncbi:C40 family peptidase [Dietzia sp. ANT_WB102]|uniref:C40 family peptidase n=1 Tax=Dietzia sp. ANT_WB102 TaxID=2597345 RepID=UPI0011EF880E|nr:C40 family peptidase [Dietzia sp. ANT_WB102]KAA0917011.1 NlpC/P60 family protein [Dietzia sp. ANT_WB102]
MIADALAYAGPIKQVLDLLSAEEFVPAEAQNIMRPVSDGLEVAQQLGSPLERLLSESWDSLASLGAAHSIAEVGRTMGALGESAAEIARVTAVAAEIVVRGTVEVIGIVQQFLARAAALGPALITPAGQAALLGLAAEHLARGIQVAERVQTELRAPTAEMRAIAAGIPPAPRMPGTISADSGSAGAINATTVAYTGSGPGAISTGGSAPGASSGGPFDGGSSGDASFGGGAGGDVSGGGDGSAAGAAGAAAGSASASGSVGFGDAGSGVIEGGTEVTLPDGSVATAPNEQAAGAVRNALSQQGVPYVWGGTTPGQGLDCSGLTQWAYRDAGVEIPRLAQEQGVGVQVSPQDLLPGDLLVWDGHVAMYIGNGQIVEAGFAIRYSSSRAFWNTSAAASDS